MQATHRPITATPAWRIRRGAVDVFVSPESGGARKPLGRVPEGGAVLSPGPAHGFRFILEPAPATELEDASPADLSEAELASWREGLGTAEALNGDLDEFHARVLARVAERARDAESRFAERLRERDRDDRAGLREAYRALAGVLESGPASEALPPAGDPLLRAASAVCAAAGIGGLLKACGRAASLLDPVESLARANRLRIRRVQLAGEWWRQDAGPMFAYDTERRPLALLPRGGHYICWNPATGASPRVTARVAEQLAGSAFTFYRPFPAERIGIPALLAFAARGMRRDAGAVLLTGALSGLIAMTVPVATGLLFDTVIPSSDRHQLLQMFVILLAAATATALLNLGRNLALLRIESRADSSLQAALWDRLLSLPATFFRGYSAGDLAQRSLAISNMRQTLTGGVVPALISGVFSIFGFVLMFFYGGTALAVPATAAVALSFAITLGAGIGQVRLQRELAASSGRVAGLLPQLLAGVTKLRVARAEQRAFSRWAHAFAGEKRIAAKARRLATGLRIFFPAFQTAATMLLFWLFASSDGVSAGSFLAFQSAFLQVLMGASQTGSALVSILAIVPQYERARPILDTVPEIVSGKSDPGELKGAIELSHVAFRYRPDLPAVLQDVSLRVNPGEFAAIVGASGSGKSTVFRLLLGFEKPESGSLFFDGQDLADLDIDLVRRQTGAVLQQGRVLAGSILQNIAGAAPLSADEAWEAARLAGLDQDLRNMPMGIHTLVAEGGMGLSGGQIQRLQIARALARRPRVILFDEATSALDNRTQAVVMESLARLKVTRVVVAHRLSTIRHADRIFVMDRGVVAESGTFDELMDRDGLFARLARRQSS